MKLFLFIVMVGGVSCAWNETNTTNSNVTHPFWSWSACGTDNMGVYGIVMSPDPPKAGSQLVVTLSGTAKASIPNGDTTLTCPFINQKNKLCDASTDCPIASGERWAAKITLNPSILAKGQTIDCKLQYSGYTCIDVKSITLT